MDQLYSLRKNFTIIGLTGKSGAGCTQIANSLSNPGFANSLKKLIVKETSDTEQLKLNVCIKYLQNDNNWNEYKIINYKDVLFLHLIYESVLYTKDSNEAIDNIIENIIQNGHSKDSTFSNRFDNVAENIDKIKDFFKQEDKSWFDYPHQNLTCDLLKECLADRKESPEFFSYYFDYFEDFSNRFFQLINSIDFTKSTRLTHDLANNLRAFGTVKSDDFCNSDIDNVYTVAETINRIIKNWKAKKETTKIIIDSLKNSLELMYFKEKYAAFYSIAVNKSESEREKYVEDFINNHFKNYSSEQIAEHVKQVLFLSNIEYDGKQVNDGEFLCPDIENCIQKSDFHIFFSNYASIKKNGYQDYEVEVLNQCPKGIEEKLKKELSAYTNLNIDIQLAKFVALINRPGIITPNAFERSMQVAFNAKVNSGCISRQVGAVVTDESYSVKAIGWNDIPRMQIPCNLRSAEDLIKGNNKEHFSDFEKGLAGEYKDGEKFNKKIEEEFKRFDTSKLEGRHCSFCFKTFHNAFEGEKNQVHTRSLHAEENAMLQITKYGGQGLKNGNLFTTASPCELCSKKAFQLGVKNIYYIDPYPGIATTHILTNSRKVNARPNLVMFQGAVGRAFHKLYDPFMSHKDELAILANIKPKENKKLKIKGLTKDNVEIELIEKILNDEAFKKSVIDLNKS
ncbi:hypothetical protein [Thalassobellus suaedae]|uniref:CMP/dCMP-type deaminase domain-containing protein n=1 Tax=Thalassobellus suaedae TaxID=3074124 RepID=A0ABY9Y3Y0_9FLAO|nr:hypothetical protein RHP49_16905 [Flavobacteriaceae bacterium HL-DH10]